MGADVHKTQLCLVAALLAGCQFGGQPQAQRSSRGEQEVRALLDQWADAFRRKDVDAVMAVYAPGNQLIAYDILPPLEYRGADAYRRDYAAFFANFAGPLEVEVRDVRIVVGADVAFSHGLERMRGILKNGSRFDTWVRFTEGYRRINGRWYAIHDHISVPADPESGKAHFDLQP